MSKPGSGRVSVIVLNWNGRDDTLECLESVRRIDYPDFDVVVVDNGSADGSVDAIRGRFPSVRVLETGKNLGFAGGNNVGIRDALGRNVEYVFLLNNDTVVDAGVLRHLAVAAESTPEGGIFGAKIYYYLQRDLLWFAGGKWSEEESNFLHVGQHEIDDGKRYAELSETDYACGCAFFVKSEVFRAVGLLDERFFLTFEETDLCYRARRVGFKSYFVPAAKIWHKVSVSMGGEGSLLFTYFIARNRLLWAEKNLPVGRRMAVYRRVFDEMAWFLLSPRLRPEDGALGNGAWSGRFLRALGSRIKDPVRRVRARAVRDYVLRRFGDCPPSVREASHG